jgi:3-phosphoshikimate 1-carboxyvinyltransferase
VRYRVRAVGRLTGGVEVPGDKSVSHRAALLGALADGPTEIHGFLESEDCLRTIAAVQALGADVTRKGPGHYRIQGAGRQALQEPDDVIDCGNSGTTARLLLGVLAGQPFWTLLTGDDSLRRRPMARVAEPLHRMGATVVGRADGTRLPLAVRGAASLRGGEFVTPVASAQVKSAILLAGLSADRPVSVREPSPSRDHSERMLKRFGARLTVADGAVTITPGALRGTTVQVPGDISSAAFLIVAGVLVPDASIAIARVGVNPTRTGVLDALDEMGAEIGRTDTMEDGEPTATLAVGTSRLRGTTVGGALIPRLIDEVPALAVAAALADGITEVRDATELRVKESDRVAAIARELRRMGARIEERPDGLVIAGGPRLQGAHVSSGGDHRMAMALTVAGLVARGETLVEDTACVATSFPRFVDVLNALAGHEAITVEP